MIELLVAGKLNNPAVEQATIDWAMGRIALPSVIVTKVKEVKSETVKVDSKTETSDSEDEGVQEVLGGGELTLGDVKELLRENKKDMNEWARDIAQIFKVDMKGKTVRQLWEALDDSQKRLAIGGLK